MSYGRGYRKKRAALKARRLPCHWCLGPIDYMAPVNHPDSFEADHLVALQHGGSDTGELVPSHAHCNRSRGAREQAARRSGPVEHVQVAADLARWLR